MQNRTHRLNLVNKVMIKVLNLKLVILLKYQNTKTFLQKAMFQIGLKIFLWLRKGKNTVPYTYVISDLKRKEIV